MKNQTKKSNSSATDGNPIEIDQNWRMKGYDSKTRKLEFYPVVFARQTIYDKKIPIKRDVWLCWISKGWLGVTDQMREWLDNNGYEHVKYLSSKSKNTSQTATDGNPKLGEGLTCKSCEHRQRWQCNSKVFQYCGVRKSNRTNNGLLKIKCKDVACSLYNPCT